MRRWISCVRPPILPVAASRVERVVVARGSMPYSAVTQPLPVPFRKLGTRSSTLAAQMTFGLPDLDQDGPFGVEQVVGREVRRTQVARRSRVRSSHQIVPI